MRIAVTSSDGTAIDVHFGKAERFLIYEVENGEPTRIDDVAVQPYCGWAALLTDASARDVEEIVEGMRECADAPPPHHMVPDTLAAIGTALAGCRIIVTAMIGDAPRKEMERRGFDIFTTTGPIAACLPELVKLY